MWIEGGEVRRPRGLAPKTSPVAGLMTGSERPAEDCTSSPLIAIEWSETRSSASMVIVSVRMSVVEPVQLKQTAPDSREPTMWEASLESMVEGGVFGSGRVARALRAVRTPHARSDWLAGSLGGRGSCRQPARCPRGSREGLPVGEAGLATQARVTEA